MSGADEDQTGRPEAPRFFGRRRGKKLRATQQSLLDALLPRLHIAEPAPATHPSSFFDFVPDEVWLEIGFGGGEHLAGQAASHPRVGIVGCEVFRNGIASLLRHLDASGAGNVRIWPEDVRRLLPFFAEASLARVFLLFPDPWPKVRHADRRFVGPGNLDALARVMADGAEFRVASDDANYIDWSLANLRDHEDFEERSEPQSVSETPPLDWIPTRYEQKALRAGRQCRYLRFWRRPRSRSEKA